MQEFLPQALEFAQRHTMMTVAWFAVFFFTIYTFYKSAVTKYKEIDNAQAIALMNDSAAVVIDLRTIDEFQRGHIIHSQHFVPSEIKAQNLGKIEHHKEKPVILVDLNGTQTAACAEILVKQGFAQVYILKDGLSAWVGANLPLVKKHK